MSSETVPGLSGGIIVSMKNSAFQNSRGSLYFGIVTALGATLGVGGALFFLLSGHAHQAALVLGITCIAMGILRGLWPGHPWFASRSRWTDVVIFLVVGVGIVLLSPWTATIAVHGT